MFEIFIVRSEYLWLYAVLFFNCERCVVEACKWVTGLGLLASIS